MAPRSLAPGINPVFSIPLNEIVVPAGRIRSLKAAQAAAIGAAMEADGQYDAITVQQGPAGLELIDGLHRLEGARLIGWSSIDASIAPLSRSGRRQEILSGWARADHDVFDKASGIKALADMARADANDRMVAPQDLQDVAMIATSLRWDLATAEALGVSRRTVGNYTVIAATFDTPEVVQILRAADLASELVPLLFLAKQTPEIRVKVIKLLQAGWRGTIAEAVARESGLVRDADPYARTTEATFRKAKAWDNGQRADFFNQWRAMFHDDGRPRAGTK